MKNKLAVTSIIAILAACWVSCSSTSSGKNPSPNPPPDTSDTTGTNPPSVDTAKYTKLSPFGVDYGTIKVSETQGYDLIIAEPSAYDYDSTKVNKLKSNGAKVIGYISLGEVGPYRSYYDDFEKRGFLGKNANFDAYFLNLADSVTYNLFFSKVIPRIMDAGFDGLFLDTIDDVAPYTPRNNLQPQMAKLVNQIRTEYPDALIVQNAGLFLLDKTHTSVNAVLKEDIATLYDFDKDTYSLRPKDSYKQLVTKFNEFSSKYDMPFLIIDFAIDENLRTEAKARLDTLPYPYFITNIGINNISDGVTGNNYK